MTQLAPPTLIATPFSEKGQITPMDIRELSAIESRVNGNERAVFDAKRDAIFISPGELRRSLSIDFRGTVLRGQTFSSVIDQLNKRTGSSNYPFFNLLLGNGFLTQDSSGKFALTKKGLTPGVLIVCSQESATETANVYLHENRHYQFYSNPKFKAEILAKAEALCPEKKLLGVFLLKEQSELYEGLSSDSENGVRFETLATELDAWAHMPSKGFDINLLGVRQGKDFGDSVDQIAQGIRTFMMQLHGKSQEEVQKLVKVNLNKDRSIIQIQDTVITFLPGPDGKISVKDGSMSVTRVIPEF